MPPQFLQLTVPTRIFDAVGVTEWASAADGEAAVEALYGPGGTQYDVIVMDKCAPPPHPPPFACAAAAACARGGRAAPRARAPARPLNRARLARPAARAPPAPLPRSQMPRMNGTEATRELRRRGFGGLVVGMTGARRPARRRAPAPPRARPAVRVAQRAHVCPSFYY